MSKFEKNQIAHHSVKTKVTKKNIVMRKSKVHEDGSITLKGVKFNCEQSSVIASIIRGAFFLGAAIVGLIWWICA